ncbi:phosphoglycolate phosphatase-like protein [Candidatus Rickettsiella viridis]|uniref:phosphoglycolate phosphatase n=1 Tax=Candidatus Rickettsiella viridis TaxID=676208 RepID=A0A2Z5UWY6_9COXI|nr:phosphoglycolate phosphatase [Candidatus Rickettsiella viridis]BBB15645.1 phosphoglycolate phosphatase-like protein [Candidatus Rickettsiella viridis]
MSVKSHSHEKIDAVLFDLDGTLLDTASDLAATLNALLLAQQLPPLPLSAIRPMISEGAAGLLKLGFNLSEKDPKFPRLRQQFIEYYSQHSCEQTQLFAGVDTLIDHLETNHVAWGIVTNKSEALTMPLIEHFPLLKKAKCIVGGDTLSHSKPHPKPLLHACECIKSTPKHCVYIGDAKRDIDAANAAGMRSLIALYGYIPNQAELNSWHATAMINTPLELIDWLKQSNKTNH